ncbi:hypothetical protein FQA47_011648 [Oryzias melastigma]|uniref:Uncharacterized protein n=1 Tax=Oryzias melastigma TaxID=30732 RepID=A0A834CLE6_ORYME|nr:hypothetical protein FQA47_011648 [Oryzias melastigma]
MEVTAAARTSVPAGCGACVWVQARPSELMRLCVSARHRTRMRSTRELPAAPPDRVTWRGEGGSLTLLRARLRAVTRARHA